MCVCVFGYVFLFVYLFLFVYVNVLLFWGSSDCKRKYMGLLYCMRKYALPRCPKLCTYAYSQRPFLISLFVPDHEKNNYEFQAFAGPIIVERADVWGQEIC